MKTVILLFMAMILGISVVAEENQSIDRDVAAGWQVVVKDGVPACVPPPYVKRKRRKKVAKPAPAPVVKEVVKEVVREVIVERASAPVRRNRVELLLGIAPYMGGLLDRTPNSVILTNRTYYPAAGLGFDRTFSETSRWSWGAQIFTNLSVFGKIGYGF